MCLVDMSCVPVCKLIERKYCHITQKDEEGHFSKACARICKDFWEAVTYETASTKTTTKMTSFCGILTKEREEKLYKVS